MKPTTMKLTLLLSAALAASLANGHAAAMLPIAATGWNQDVVIGAGDTTAGRTATMDGSNTRYTWYGVGYNTTDPTTGLPTGLTTSTATPTDLSFQLQPFGTSAGNVNNAIYQGGTLTMTTPMPYIRLALIGATGSGSSNMTVTVNYSSGPAQVFGLNNAGVARDWFGGGDIARTANGRVDVDNGGFDNVNNNNPRLYQSVLALNNTTDNVTSVVIATSGGNNAIMAISGEAIPEVSSFALLGLSAIGFALRRRR